MELNRVQNVLIIMYKENWVSK